MKILAKVKVKKNSEERKILYLNTLGETEVKNQLFGEFGVDTDKMFSASISCVNHIQGKINLDYKSGDKVIDLSDPW